MTDGAGANPPIGGLGTGWRRHWLSIACSAIALVAVAVCAVAAYWFDDSSFGAFSQAAGFPLASLAFGAFAADAYYRFDGDKRVNENVQLAAYTSLSMKQAVELADAHLAAAKNLIDEGKEGEAAGHIIGAKTATYLAIATSRQSIHQLTILASNEVVASVSARFAEDEQMIQSSRPRIERPESVPPQASREEERVEDQSA